MRRRAWPFLVAVAVLAPAATASAAKAPPRAELRANHDSTRIGPWTYSWFYPSGESCAGVHSDGFPSYRRRIGVAHDHARPRVVFLRDRKPRVERFRAYAALDESGLPSGNGKRVESTVKPKRNDGDIIGWAVRFRVNVAARPYFDLDVAFRERGRCDAGGEASYAFGIKRE